MYKYLEHNGMKHPVRVSQCVVGEWQDETGKTEVKNLTFKDIKILLWHSLMEGAEFADKPFTLKMRDVKLMMEDGVTVGKFIALIPEFFPKEEKGDEEASTPEEGKPIPLEEK